MSKSSKNEISEQSKGPQSAKIGFVGFPNVGKSSLFNLFLGKELSQVGKHAFCTIDPKIAEAEIFDKNLKDIAKQVIINSNKDIEPKLVYSKLQCVDIAGLIKGASAGQGLGNQFLSHIRQVDLILHVVRCFDDDEVPHVENSIDPERDIEIINTELILADAEMCQRLLERNKKSADNSLRELLEKALPVLNANKLFSAADIFSEKESVELKRLGFITIRPMVYLLNGSKEIAKPYLRPNAIIVNVAEGMIENVISFCCDYLDIITFYTAGPKEVRAWLIGKGCVARYAAGAIHSDFITKFIAAEVISLEEFLQGKAQTTMKKANYIVQPGDIINFKVGR